MPVWQGEIRGERRARRHAALLLRAVPPRERKRLLGQCPCAQVGLHASVGPRDRKSTRLNSSHLGISYAVFCLKKKKNKIIQHHCVNIFVIIVVWILLPRLAQFKTDTPTAISSTTCISVDTLMN